MKVSIDNLLNDGNVFEDVKYLDVEIDDIKYSIRVNNHDKSLSINKVDFGINSDAMIIMPHVTNQISIK